MNPFLNPLYTIPYLKNALVEPKRIQKLSPKQLKQFKDKAIKRVLSQAFKVPLYQKKFKKHNIKKEDIKKIEDVRKLPFTNRADISQNFPDNIIPSSFNKEKGFVICTGGTSGKYCCNSGSDPVCIYTDFPSLLKGYLISNRANNYYNISLRKTKIAHIGNYNPFKIDEVFEKNVIEHAKSFFPMKNFLSMHATSRTQEIIETLDKFKPDVIISYPAIYQDLAYLKRKGFGKNIKPRHLFVGGAMLDEYTRKYVENSFQCNMYNTYASCEMGAEIAFECKHRNWHYHSDYYHLEAVDQQMNPVSSGERGKLVITRLWGNGTPIIRYTGMQDWITLSNGQRCSCGLKSPIFGKPVEGRIMSNIVLADGTIYSPSEFLFITKAFEELNTFKVTRYQIIQKSFDQIDILIVIDEDLKNTPPSFNEISDKIIKVYKEKIGDGIQINVKEVKEIKNDNNKGKPAPLVMSLVNKQCELN